MLPVAETLREQQRRLAHQLILRAAADEIVEHGLERLSLQAVADRAGVAKRTLYNHFDSRETLLAGLSTYSDELTVELGGVLTPSGLDELPATVERVWASWAAQGNVFEALVRVLAATSDRPLAEDRRRRQRAIADAIREVRPELDDPTTEEIASLLHGLVSPNLYERLFHEDDLPIERAGALVSWTITLVRDALTAGDLPRRPDQPAQQEDQT